MKIIQSLVFGKKPGNRLETPSHRKEPKSKGPKKIEDGRGWVGVGRDEKKPNGSHPRIK